MEDQARRADILEDLKNDVADTFEKYVSEFDLKESIYGSAYKDKLSKARSDFYLDEGMIRPGQFVEWKPGLKNKRKPEYHQPVIVMELLDEPIYDKRAEAGSPYFREPLDIILGFFDSDDDFVAYHFDSRRFKVVEGLEPSSEVEVDGGR